MRARRAGLALRAALACALLAGAGGLSCDTNQRIPDPLYPWPPWVQTPPEHVLKNLVAVYNDTEHTATERLAAYESLLLHAAADSLHAGFRFHFASDFGQLPPSWGLDAELAAHAGLFAAQADSTVVSLELELTHGASTMILDDPERVGWEEIFVSRVYMLLMFDADHGLEVNGDQARFAFAPDANQPPPEGGRYYRRYWIGEWIELLRPAATDGASVEPATWGGIKAQFIPLGGGARSGGAP